MDLNYIMETILNIMIINLIGIIIITFTIALHLLCELMIKKYARRKLMDKTTQTEYRKYSEDDLENIYIDASNNIYSDSVYANTDSVYANNSANTDSVYTNSVYQYAKRMKTRSRY